MSDTEKKSLHVWEIEIHGLKFWVFSSKTNQVIQDKFGKSIIQRISLSIYLSLHLLKTGVYITCRELISEFPVWPNSEGITNIKYWYLQTFYAQEALEIQKNEGPYTDIEDHQQWDQEKCENDPVTVRKAWLLRA